MEQSHRCRKTGIDAHFLPMAMMRVFLLLFCSTADSFFLILVSNIPNEVEWNEMGRLYVSKLVVQPHHSFSFLSLHFF